MEEKNHFNTTSVFIKLMSRKSVKKYGFISIQLLFSLNRLLTLCILRSVYFNTTSVFIKQDSENRISMPSVISIQLLFSLNHSICAILVFYYILQSFKIQPFFIFLPANPSFFLSTIKSYIYAVFYIHSKNHLVIFHPLL